jgi:hypothetical protein
MNALIHITEVVQFCNFAKEEVKLKTAQYDPQKCVLFDVSRQSLKTYFFGLLRERK